MPSSSSPNRQRALFWVVLALVASAAALVSWRLELTPRVESDFFFASDDPQLRASERIAELFPTPGQVLISARSDNIDSPEYRERIADLTSELKALDGVTGVRSLSSGPADPGTVGTSPVWSRLLYARPPQDPDLTPADEPGGEARNIPQTFSQLIVSLDDDSRSTIAAIEEVVEGFRAPSFVLQISGVPYVVELIRRHLLRDLRLFSIAAFSVFGLLIVVLYRSFRIAVGTLICCSSAALLTLSTLHLLGLRVGLLTANLLTIVFVLTLSHIVFLTANWRRLASDAADGAAALGDAIGVTLQASFWCMVTTLLGFASLLLANAKPLRELGLAGALGSVAAILVAYGLYPSFLRGVAPRGSRTAGRRWPRWLGRSSIKVLTIALGLATVVAALGLRSVDTDPSLLSYFAEGSDLRQGLEFIDQQGGSSPLYLVVRDPEGRRLTQGEVAKRLAAVQRALEEDPEVGLSLSLPVLLEEAERVPLAILLGRDKLVDLLDSDAFGNIARSFVTADRHLGLFFLRLHESGRTVPRRQVVARLTDHVAEQGLATELVGGLYELQGQLGALVASSVVTGLGCLLGLFLLIAAFLSRSPRLTAIMVLTLATVPVLLLGSFGLVGQPLDVISSPAANIAIALGIDSMIHLLAAVRRRRAAGDDDATAWAVARARMAAPILGAALLLAVGFGIFALSSFPPTQRFGLLVAAGTVLAAVLSLVVLPFLAAPRTHRSDASADRDETSQAA